MTPLYHQCNPFSNSRFPPNSREYQCRSLGHRKTPIDGVPAAVAAPEPQHDGHAEGERLVATGRGARPSGAHDARRGAGGAGNIVA